MDTDKISFFAKPMEATPGSPISVTFLQIPSFHSNTAPAASEINLTGIEEVHQKCLELAIQILRVQWFLPIFADLL